MAEQILHYSCPLCERGRRGGYEDRKPALVVSLLHPYLSLSLSLCKLQMFFTETSNGTVHTTTQRNTAYTLVLEQPAVPLLGSDRLEAADGPANATDTAVEANSCFLIIFLLLVVRYRWSKEIEHKSYSNSFSYKIEREN